MERFKKTSVLLLTIVLILTMITACGGGDEEEDYNIPEEEQLVAYTSNDLGFKMEMQTALFGIAAFGTPETAFDDQFQMNRTSMLVSGIIQEVKVPLVEVNIFEGEFDAEQLEALNPMMVYVGTCEGRTYTLQYSEEAGGIYDDAADLEEYNNIMNNMVIGMEEHMTLFAPGSLEEDNNSTDLQEE